MVAPELAARVRQLVAKLPAAQRQVVTLRDVEGLPSADVCGMVTIRRAKPDAHDITCQQAVALMTDYLDGALGPDDCALMEAHLAECESCAEHLRQIRITVADQGTACAR